MVIDGTDLANYADDNTVYRSNDNVDDVTVSVTIC